MAGMAGARPGGGMRAGNGRRPGPAARAVRPAADAATSDSMIVLKVDADKLPKAADLKAQIFPTTFSISLADGEIRFVSRGAFPDLSVLIGTIPVAGHDAWRTIDARSNAAAASPTPATPGDRRSASERAGRRRGQRPGTRGRRGGRGRPAGGDPIS